MNPDPYLEETLSLSYETFLCRDSPVEDNNCGSVVAEWGLQTGMHFVEDVRLFFQLVCLSEHEELLVPLTTQGKMKEMATVSECGMFTVDG